MGQRRMGGHQIVTTRVKNAVESLAHTLEARPERNWKKRHQRRCIAQNGCIGISGSECFQRRRATPQNLGRLTRLWEHSVRLETQSLAILGAAGHARRNQRSFLMGSRQEAGPASGKGDKGASKRRSGFLHAYGMVIAIAIGHAGAPEREIDESLIIADSNARFAGRPGEATFPHAMNR
ncbi:hypothetical protein AA0535_0253 [Asaia krungthepensis NRIC 0535]|uniref:Uncharacterized protein n=1 Tax=Asaia krungthepensis NRIC 0535 TaxID=1307925 RepID=A0ABQ0PWR3_9PROT|nr:hypothetical protein AA0535_0253 [Asaia krungthepensis NRIC 0535]